MTFMRYLVSLGHERKDCEVTRALDGLGELPLVDRADTRDASRQNLAPLGNEVPQQSSVLVIDIRDLLGAELADSLAPQRESLRTWHRATSLSGLQLPESRRLLWRR